MSLTYSLPLRNRQVEPWIGYLSLYLTLTYGRKNGFVSIQRQIVFLLQQPNLVEGFDVLFGFSGFLSLCDETAILEPGLINIFSDKRSEISTVILSITQFSF